MSDTVIKCTSIADFERKLKRDLKALRKRVDKAVAKTSRGAVRLVVENSPKAFGELRESVHAESRSDGTHATVVSAPHAAAVEIGARPHLVPLENLIAWVKLRGIQGLDSAGRIKGRFKSGRKIGTTTAMQARNVARQIKSAGRGGVTPIDAPEKIARAIQAAIAKAGTQPHWYVRGVLADIVALLDSNIKTDNSLHAGASPKVPAGPKKYTGSVTRAAAGRMGGKQSPAGLSTGPRVAGLLGTGNGSTSGSE